jgi:hypothetical protein
MFWANDCPKHVELIQGPIKLLLLHLVGHLYYSLTLMMQGQTHIKHKSYSTRIIYIKNQRDAAWQYVY